jgi:hypothetical protein
MSTLDKVSILSPSVVLVVALVGAFACGCGSSAPATSTVAAVTGPVDMHCEMNDMEIKQSIGMCIVGDGSTTSALSSNDAGGTDAASVDGSAGAAVDAGDAGAVSNFGATMYNSSGSDDDCKYDVKWTSTAVKENVGVLFDVNAIRRIDGKPATGANVQLDVYLNDHHPTPSFNIPNKESAGGNYQAGPVIFDAPGRWIVRFHFYETCSDAPADSPHGHAAFYVNVP